MTSIVVLFVIFGNVMAIKDAKRQKNSAFIWKALADGISLIYLCIHLILLG